MKRVGCLGLWHLGCVYGVCLAEQGFKVVGFDVNKTVVKNLQKKIPPIFEPGLETLIKKHNNKNLIFTHLAKDAIVNQDYVFITLDTPINNRDIISLRLFNLLFEEVKDYLQPETILVVSSQVPVGTCYSLKRQLELLKKDNHVLYFPENLRLGQAIDGFLKPDRIILGGGDAKTRKRFLSDFAFLQCPILEMSFESAEMTKHALNSYLALLISFSSEISDLCEALGADATDVVNALKTDRRVSIHAPLNPGMGFAGGTLGRDLQILKMISKKINYNPKLIKAVHRVNRDRLSNLVKKISNVIGSLRRKKIGLLGLTYKPNTNTLRRSQSIELTDLLNKQGVSIHAIDPAIKSDGIKSIKVYQQYDEFFKGLDAIILMTPWEEFKELKPKKIAALVRKKIIFDTRNFLDKDLFEKAGFLYVGIGKVPSFTKS